MSLDLNCSQQVSKRYYQYQAKPIGDFGFLEENQLSTDMVENH